MDIVPIDSEDNVLLVRQYRKAAEIAMLEVPAGGIESGKEPLECARRELAEEIGFAAKQWERLNNFYTNPGFCTEIMHMYFASDLVPNRLDAVSDKNIQLVRVPFKEIAELIESGEICDAKSIAGLIMVLRNRQL